MHFLCFLRLSVGGDGRQPFSTSDKNYCLVPRSWRAGGQLRLPARLTSTGISPAMPSRQIAGRSKAPLTVSPARPGLTVRRFSQPPASAKDRYFHSWLWRLLPIRWRLSGAECSLLLSQQRLELARIKKRFPFSHNIRRLRLFCLSFEFLDISVYHFPKRSYYTIVRLLGL